MYRPLFILMLAAAVAANDPQGSTNYYCAKGFGVEGDFVRFEYNLAPGDNVARGFVVGSSSTPGCYDDDVTDDKVNLKIEVGSCGIVPDSDDTANVSIVIARHPFVVTAFDDGFTFTCVFKFLTVKAGEDFQVPSMSPNSDGVEKGEEALLLVVDTDDNETPINSCSLNQFLKLRIQLTKSDSASGVLVHDCEARPHGNSDDYVMMHEDGCASGELFSPILNTGFIGNQTGPDPSTYYYSMSDEFCCFRFIDQPRVYFNCSVTYCVGSDGNYCDMNSCENAARRKRDDDVYLVEKQIGVTIRVDSDAVAVQLHEDTSKPGTPLLTTTQQLIWMFAGAATLIIGVFLVAAFFFYKRYHRDFDGLIAKK